MKDVERYLRIIRLIRAGQASKLSKTDYKFFSQFTFDVDQEAIEKLQKSKEFEGLSSEEVTTAMQNGFLQAVQHPEYREKILTAAQDIEQGELASKIATAVNTGLAAFDIGTSLSQIQAGDRAARNLQRPAAPAPLTADPALDRAMADASRGNLDAARALSPAQLQILDQYLSDLNTAKTVSGGQAGVYGSLAQVASTRRGRRAAELAPIYDDITRRSETRYDQLLAQKLQQNRAIQESQAQNYPYELQQYGFDSRTAAELGAIGRSNLRSSLGSAGQIATDVIPKLMARRRFKNIYNEGLAYGENNAKIMADADMNLRRDVDERIYQQQLADFYGRKI